MQPSLFKIICFFAGLSLVLSCVDRSSNEPSWDGDSDTDIADDKSKKKSSTKKRRKPKPDGDTGDDTGSGSSSGGGSSGGSSSGGSDADADGDVDWDTQSPKDVPPPLFCDPTVKNCAELIQFKPTIGFGYIDVLGPGETETNQYRSWLMRGTVYMIKCATARVEMMAKDWQGHNGQPMIFGVLSGNALDARDGAVSRPVGRLRLQLLDDPGVLHTCHDLLVNPSVRIFADALPLLVPLTQFRSE